MTENDRRTRIMERIQEDERLRGDLEDDAAAALITWASDRAGAAADDPQRPDAAVDADVQAVRRAVRIAARSGDTDPARLIAVAEAELAGSLAPGSARVLSAVPEPVASDSASAADPSVGPQAPATAEPEAAPPARAPAADLQSSGTPTLAAPEAPQTQTSTPLSTPPAPAGARAGASASTKGSDRSSRANHELRRKRRRLNAYLKRASRNR